MKSLDIISLQGQEQSQQGQVHMFQRFPSQPQHQVPVFLRSYDLKFTVDNENYQEVVTHDQRIGGNDQVCITNAMNFFLKS